MEWFLFALLAPILFAIGNVIDKFALTKKLRDPFSYNIITIFIGIIPTILVPLFLPISFEWQYLLGILYGVIFSVIYVLYNKAMMEGEVSRMVSIMYMIPVFTMVLSTIFLQEYLSLENYPIKYFGVILLVISAILVSYKKEKRKKHLVLSPIIIMLIYAFGSASMKVLSKYVLNFIDYWSFFFWGLIGNLIGAFILLITISHVRKNFVKDILRIDKRTWSLLFLTDFFNYAAYLVLFIAISLGFVSLVMGVASIQPMIVFIFVLFLSLYKPHHLKEEITKSIILLKALAVILIFVGGYFITI